MINHFVKNDSEKLLLFTRNSLIRNARSNYDQIFTCLKLAFDCDGELFIHGFVKITTDTCHNWSNFLFVKKSNLEIV